MTFRVTVINLVTRKREERRYEAASPLIMAAWLASWNNATWHYHCRDLDTVTRGLSKPKEIR